MKADNLAEKRDRMKKNHLPQSDLNCFSQELDFQELFMFEASMKKQDLSLFKIPPGFRGRSGGYVQLWWLVQATLFRWSPQFAYRFRAALLRLFGAKIGKNTVIRPSVKITYPWKVSLGDRAWIGDDVVLYSLGEINIGNDSVISQKSYLCAGDHAHQDVSFSIRSRPIVIGNECWIATDVYVAPGITIQDQVVVGARSSVFNDLQGGMVYVGNPARAVKPRVSETARVLKINDAMSR